MEKPQSHEAEICILLRVSWPRTSLTIRTPNLQATNQCNMTVEVLT